MDPYSQLKFQPYTGELNLEARLYAYIMAHNVILRWSKCTSIPETLKSLLMNNPACSCHCQKKNIIHLCIFTNSLFAIFPGNNLNVFFASSILQLFIISPNLLILHFLALFRFLDEFLSSSSRNRLSFFPGKYKESVLPLEL